MMDRDKLMEVLVDKYDYKNSQVGAVADKILAFDPRVAAAFGKWMETGVIDETEVAGYTVAGIIAKKKMKVVGAYLTLDWLAREPEQARQALAEPEFQGSLSAPK